MKLDLIMLANHAEVPNNLLYIHGGGWDTLNVSAPTQNAPPDVFTLMQGMLIVRLLFHSTETGRDHSFRVVVADADGHEIQKIEGGMSVPRNEGIPAGWDQNFNMVLNMGGLPLPAPGHYLISLLVDDQHVGDRPFRVVKGY